MKRLFRLYIDESGDHTYHKVDEVSERYLGLTGCIIEAEYYRKTFYPSLEKLKQDHFPHSPDDPVILHRKDIINKHGAFWRLREREKEDAFNRDLLDFFKKQSYRIITVVIDKKIHLQRYGMAAFHPYHYCLAAMLERYCGLLRFIGAKGDVMAESRGGREDTHLKKAYTCIYKDGTQFWSPKQFQSVLTSRDLCKNLWAPLCSPSLEGRGKGEGGSFDFISLFISSKYGLLTITPTLPSPLKGGRKIGSAPCELHFCRGLI